MKDFSKTVMILNSQITLMEDLKSSKVLSRSFIKLRVRFNSN